MALFIALGCMQNVVLTSAKKQRREYLLTRSQLDMKRYVKGNRATAYGYARGGHSMTEIPGYAATKPSWFEDRALRACC